VSANDYLFAGLAFALAALGNSLALPLASQLGKRFGLVRRRRSAGRRRHGSASFLGGVTLAVVATACLWIAGALSLKAASALAGGGLLLVVGLADDRSSGGQRKGGPLAGPLWLGAEAAAALVAWMGGVRLGLASPAVDAALSTLLLVVVVNGFNLLDNTEGVAASAAALSAAGVFALAAGSGQHLVAILGAVVGGCATGLLVGNLSSDPVYLGYGGSRFLGLLVGVSAMQLRFQPGGRQRLPVLLAALAVPVAYTLTAGIARLFNGRPMRRGADVLSRRLGRLGLSLRAASMLHAAVAAAGAGAAVLAVRTGTPLPALVALIGVASGVLIVLRRGSSPLDAATPALGSSGSSGSRPRRVIVASVAVAAVVVLLPALAAAMIAQRHLSHGRAALLDARNSLASLQPAAAEAALNRADPELRSGTAWLTSVATWPARLIPGLKQNISVPIALARSGQELTAAGRQSASVLESLGVRGGQLGPLWHEGTLDVAAFQKAASAASAVQHRFATAQRLLDSSSSSFLIPQVSRARRDSLTAVASAGREANTVVALTSLLPKALGAEGARRWMVGAANTAELRGRSGYLGAFAILKADRGHIALSAFQGVERLPVLATAFNGPDVAVEYRDHYRTLGGLNAWPNLTMSPNFPSGADLLLSRLQASGGPVAGGAVSLDPTALSYLMEVTGPVQVAGVPDTLTAGNVVDWALNRIYALDAAHQDQRKATLADIAQAVWQRILTGQGSPLPLGHALGRALREGHLLVYSNDRAEQADFSSLGITGEVNKAPGDYLMVLAQNFGENKMDYYMQREVTYRGRPAADGSLDVNLQVTLHNRAPAGAALTDFIGGARPHLGLPANTGRSYLSVFVPSPARLTTVSVDGAAAKDVDNAPELGRRYFATPVDVSAGQSVSVVFSYTVPKAFPGGLYRLSVQNQATVHPDRLSVDVTLPDGVRPPNGATSRVLTWSGRLTSDLQLGSSANDAPSSSLAAH
jgi:UDP-N-acetylmuramyl pentapeptide phosphotransferase/UDP-N-acetylglucosamine-1-phosphate transferase